MEDWNHSGFRIKFIEDFLCCQEGISCCGKSAIGNHLGDHLKNLGTTTAGVESSFDMNLELGKCKALNC